MLQYLRIKNLALMSAAELEFCPRFTVVTGETGAGKSVLLGALSLLAGNRADKTAIRQGADVCEVEGVLHFQNAAAVDAALAALGLPPCEDGALVLRRTLAREKAPRVQINGALSTLAALRALGDLWVDFHGSNEPQKLFQPAAQRTLLDDFGALNLAPYQTAYREWRAALAALEAARAQGKLSDDEITFYRAQIEKIDALALSKDGIAALERDFTRLTHAREMAELSQKIADGLSGDDGVSDRLGALVRFSEALADIDPDAAALRDRMHALGVEAADLAAEYAARATEDDIDPEAAADIQNRMAAWLELRRKYGDEVETVLAKRAEWAQKIERQGDLDAFLERETARASAMEARLRAQAKALTQQRRKAAESLAKQARERLLALGFKKAALSIDIVPEPLCETGDSAVEIQFSPNPGTPPMPLRKIASGGETARVLLALKTAMADADKTPLLVFDEVDANVGGEIGAEVGQQLRALGARHQVFCVTHLPQVAALGDAHLLVRKETDGTHTTVAISELHGNRKARVAELARMLGDRNSASALSHARSLLS